MAKGDKKKMQNQTDYQTGLSQNNLNNQRDLVVGQNQMFNNQYSQASNEAAGDYRNIMDQYRNFQASPANERYNPERVNYNRSAELDSALRGYQGFADTGGFSPEAIQDMRARGVSPIRAAYGNARNELIRQRALQGGYSPNMAPALARMASSQSGMMSDAMQEINGQLAKMQQEGRLAGLSGLGNLSVQDLNFAQQAQLANQAAGLNAAHLNATNIDPMRLSAIHGQAQLFGQQPGMARMFGDNLLNSTNQLMNTNNQQMNLANMALGAQNMTSQTPSNFETALGRAGQIGGMVSSIAAPFLTGGASSLIPANRALSSGLRPGMQNINSGLYSAPGMR